MSDRLTDFGSPLPEVPSAASITQLTALLRHISSAMAGAGLGGTAVATLTDAQITAIASLILTIGSTLLWIATVCWSLWSDWKRRHEDHAGSVASAKASAAASIEAGQPVAVVVPPP